MRFTLVAVALAIVVVLAIFDMSAAMPLDAVDSNQQAAIQTAIKQITQLGTANSASSLVDGSNLQAAGAIADTLSGLGVPVAVASSGSQSGTGGALGLVGGVLPLGALAG